MKPVLLVFLFFYCSPVLANQLCVDVFVQASEFDQIVFETEHYEVRVVKPSEVESFFEILLDPQSLEMSRDKIDRQIAQEFLLDPSVQTYGEGRIKIFSDSRTEYLFISNLGIFNRKGEMIGTAVINEAMDNKTYQQLKGEVIKNGEFWLGQLGYYVARKQWGKGIASELLPAMLEFSFNTLSDRLNVEIHGVIVDVHPENAASIKVIEKSGLVKAQEVKNSEGFQVYYSKNPNL